MSVLMIIGLVLLAVFILYLLIRFGGWFLLAILDGFNSGSSGGDGGSFGGGDSGGGGSSSDF